MLDRVPVPTDNIYKFIALFSLVTVIFCAWQVLRVGDETNALVFQTYPEIAGLEEIEKPTAAQTAKLASLKRQVDIAVDDRQTKIISLSIFAAIGLVSLIGAFSVWYQKIQPLADATARAQLRLLRLQAVQLRLENRKLFNALKAEETPQVAPSPPQPSVLAQVITALLTRR